MNYDQWIDRHYPTPDDARNRCHSASAEMAKTFPELKVVRGWYGGHEHWWCRSPVGLVVDPTYRQFASLTRSDVVRDPWGTPHYVEFREGVDPEVVGKCMNCGMEIWDRDPETWEPLKPYSTCICSRECEEDFRASLEEG